MFLAPKLFEEKEEEEEADDEAEDEAEFEAEFLLMRVISGK